MTEPVRQHIANFATKQLYDRAILAGQWSAEFSDPSVHGGPIPLTVDVKLSQFGKRLSGYGEIRGKPGDRFDFQGFVKRNVFIGTYARTNRHVLAGTGNFVLKIVADSKRMHGKCLWYDGLLDEVWTSGYLWKR